MAASVCAGCKTQSLDARSRFAEDGVQIEAHDQWSGERIDVDNAGVSEAGGLSITSDGERTRVLAVARMVVVADTTEKPVADRAILAAKATFAVTTSYPLATSFSNPKVTAVRCGQVSSSAGDPAGCDALAVTLPTGKEGQPLSLDVRSGTGRVTVALGGEVAALDLHASRGPIDVRVPATRGAVITVVAETGNDVVLRLPRDFAADVVTLEGGAIDTAAFPDVLPGKGRGPAGVGARSITVRSGVNGGRIVLLVQ